MIKLAQATVLPIASTISADAWLSSIKIHLIRFIGRANKKTFRQLTRNNKT